MTSGESEPPSDDVRDLFRRLGRLIDVDPRGAARGLQSYAGSAWSGVTREEPRVQVTIAIVVAIGLMLALPGRVANEPRWILPVLAGLLLIGVF